MKIQEHTNKGIKEHTLTTTELKERAIQGDRTALKELIDLKGGYDNLTAEQKEKVNKILIGYDVVL